MKSKTYPLISEINVIINVLQAVIGFSFFAKQWLNGYMVIWFHCFIASLLYC